MMIKENRLNMRQKIQMKAGEEDGLAWTQIAFYCRPEFTAEQMETARQGFARGLSMKQLRFLYRPEFSAGQMLAAIWGFENGLSEEQVAAYYKPEYSDVQMAKRAEKEMMREKQETKK